MNLYEISNEILNCVDGETGEIIDFERLQELEIEKNTKIENLGLWYKNLLSDAQAFKKEIEILKERKKKAESKAEQIKNWISNVLNGGKFETARMQMTWRKSKTIETKYDFIEWARKNRDDLLTFKEPIPNKKAIKAALESGQDVHALEVDHNNLTIK